MAIDIRLALDLETPGAAYGWRGGDPSDYSQVEWRDQVIVQPTIEALNAVWATYESDQATDGETWAAIKTTAGTAVGVNYGALTATQLRSLFAILLYRADALDKNGNVRPLGEWVRD